MIHRPRTRRSLHACLTNRLVRRRAYSLVELLVASAVSTLLLAGMASSIYIASQALDIDQGTSAVRSANLRAIDQVLRDVRHALAFTERTATTMTFAVPDRDGDGANETIRYAWSGIAGDPLTYELNGASGGPLIRRVDNIDFTYLTRTMTALDLSGSGGGASSTITFEEFTDQQEESGVTSTTLDTPPGTTENDLLIAVVVADGDDLLSPPAGWTEVSVGVANNRVAVGVWWKLAGSSEPASHLFTWDDPELSYSWIMRFTGHDVADPIDAFASGNGNSDTPTSPSVTTTVADALILRIGGFNDDSITVGNTGLTGHQTIVMEESNDGAGTVSGGAGFVAQASVGDSGTSSFSLTSNERWWTVTIAIAPEVIP